MRIQRLRYINISTFEVKGFDVFWFREHFGIFSLRRLSGNSGWFSESYVKHHKSDRRYYDRIQKFDGPYTQLYVL